MPSSSCESSDRTVQGLDFGGEGRGHPLLHGLAGYAGEWAQTAGWLSRRGRVVALNARGHGGTQRVPADVSRAAHVADAVLAIEALELAPVVVIGQSLGAQLAILLAEARPDLVRALVVAEGGPGDGDPDAVEQEVASVTASLARWPVPFATPRAAIEFFGGPSLRAETWAGGLERRAGGLWPRFDLELMARTLREALGQESWAAWERVSCPVLLVHAQHGNLTAADAQEMAERGRHVEVVEIAGAGHDVHLDRPLEWRNATSRFLGALES